MEVVRTRINVDEVNRLIEEKFRGNKTWFAEEIGVDASYVNQVLNKKAIDHSPKILNGFMKYCEHNNIDIKPYIFLGWWLKKINREENEMKKLKMRQPHKIQGGKENGKENRNICRRSS